MNTYQQLTRLIFFFTWIFLSTGVCIGQSKKAQSLFLKGQNDFDQKKYIGASVHLTDAIFESQEYTEAYELRGLCWYNINKTDQAIEDFRRALSIDSLKMVPKYYLMQIYKQSNDIKSAVEMSTLIIRLNKDNRIAGLYDRSMLYEQIGEFELALEDCKEIILSEDPEMEELIRATKERLKSLEKKLRN